MEDKKIIINVGRQLGSGGHIIAAMLAKDFGCKLYDRELLNLAARESGFCEKFFEQNDEHKGFFKSLFHIHTPYVIDSNFYNNKFSQESLFQFQSDAVLRDRKNVVNIFVTADMEERVAQIRDRYQCDEQNARKIIASREGERASYYNYYTGKKWGHSASYDLCINSSLLGLEETEKFIVTFIKKRFDIE